MHLDFAEFKQYNGNDPKQQNNKIKGYVAAQRKQQQRIRMFS